MAINNRITTRIEMRGPGRAPVALIIAAGLVEAVAVGVLLGQQFGPWSSSDGKAGTVTTAEAPFLSDLDIMEAFGPFTARPLSTRNHYQTLRRTKYMAPQQFRPWLTRHR